MHHEAGVQPQTVSDCWIGVHSGCQRSELGYASGIRAGTGVAEEAEVPDTLDLAERPALAVNALTGAAEGPGNRTSR